MSFWRAFFGLEPAGNRTVVGHKPSLDVKEVGFIKDSNARLHALHQLCTLYQDTPHAAKINSVYEKTKSVHTYLASKQRFHELELFHVQHTDHFISTFALIIDVHQRNEALTLAYGKNQVLTQSKPGPVGQLVSAEKSNLNGYTHQSTNGKHHANQKPFIYPEEEEADLPRLTVPVVSISTYGKIIYLKDDNADGLVANEISYTSTETEKEAFLRNVSARLGIRNISYVGNAMVNIPNNNGFNPTALVPVIHWQNAMYALNLHDYRLFPVRMHRHKT